ncbi:MAG: DKNYY domain-containing protein [Candidatus Peregrinibacteria bacterium]
MFRSPFLASIVLVFVLCSSLSALAQSFSDVPDSHPYAEAIEYVKTQGIVKGYEDGTFKPDATINRAEFLKILLEAQFGVKNSEIEQCATDSFRDIHPDAWFAPYICFAKAQDIIKGYADGTFRAPQNISFVESAKIILRTMAPQKEIKENTEKWYEPYMTTFSDYSLIPLSIEDVSQNITRGEMAEIIFRIQEMDGGRPSRTYTSGLDNPPIEQSSMFSVENGKAYGNGEAIPNADIKTFTPIKSSNYAKDKNRAYYLKPVYIHYGDYRYYTHTLENIDTESFEVLSTEPPDGNLIKDFAKDKNHVFLGDEIIVGADPQKFSFIRNEYQKDKNKVYWNGQSLPSADPNTFEILGNSYGKDKKNVYWKDKKILRADPESLQNVPYNSLQNHKKENIFTAFLIGHEMPYLIKDKNAVYFHETKVKDADVNTFERIGNHYFRDKNSVFVSCYYSSAEYYHYSDDPCEPSLIQGTLLFGGVIPIHNVNPSTFQILKDEESDFYSFYGKDDQHVFFRDTIIESADVSSFHIIKNNYKYDAEDKNSWYFNGKKVDSAF